MDLNRRDRDYYVQRLETDPQLGGTWQASFVEGDVWIDGDEGDDGWAWLIAGPLYNAEAVGQDPEETDAVVSKSITPMLRLIADEGVLISKPGTPINVWGH